MAAGCVCYAFVNDEVWILNGVVTSEHGDNQFFLKCCQMQNIQKTHFGLVDKIMAYHKH